MNPHIYYFLGFVFSIVATYDYENSERLNFGTVIFKYQDLNKHNWSKRQIGLLYARMYFQNIIEFLNNLDIHDENYVNEHFRFFQDAYESVQRHARDPEANIILTTALSDTIGGYLKAKVLPVTKYAYYAGSVPYQSVASLYDFYHDIKQQLKTTGESWHQPQQDILRSIHITDINTAAHDAIIEDIRNLQCPCQQLAYYEKRPKIGLTAPIPKIRWARNATTLFLPFENQTLFPILSPNCTRELFKYFVVATSCLQSKYAPQEPAVKDFEQRFQKWLNNDVVPHLHEDELYPGLGGILALVTCVNDPNDYFPSAPIAKHHHPMKPLKNKKVSPVSKNPLHHMSKKLLVILILLFVEIMWCIPALACVWTWKRRSDSGDSENSRDNDPFKICRCLHKSKSAGPVDVLFRNKHSKNNQTSTGSSLNKNTSCSSVYNVLESTPSSSDKKGERRSNSTKFKRNTPPVKDRKKQTKTSPVMCDITVQYSEKGTMKSCPSQSTKNCDKDTMKGLSAVMYLEKETMQGSSFTTAGATQSRPETDFKSCHSIVARESLETTVPYRIQRNQRPTSIDNQQYSSVTLRKYSQIPSSQKISTTTDYIQSCNKSRSSGVNHRPSSSIVRKSSASHRKSSIENINVTLVDADTSAGCFRSNKGIPDQISYECINEKKNKKTTSFPNELIPKIDIKNLSNKHDDDVKVDMIGIYATPDEEMKNLTDRDYKSVMSNNNIATNLRVENVKGPSKENGNQAGTSKATKPKLTVNLDIELVTCKGKQSKIPKLSISPSPRKKTECGRKMETKITPKETWYVNKVSHIPILRLKRVVDDSVVASKKNSKEDKLNVTL